MQAANAPPQAAEERQAGAGLVPSLGLFTTIIAAISSTIKLYPVTVLVKRGEAGLRKNSMVNLAQLLTVDKSRLRKKLGRLRPATMAAVDEAIRVSLDVF